MAADYSSERRNSNARLLEELETLSKTPYQSHTSSTTARKTASLALPRTSASSFPSAEDGNATPKGNTQTNNNKPRPRRLSLSPWKSRPKHEDANAVPPTKPDVKKFYDTENSADKRGIRSWRPIRALSHIGMQKLSCLFSVEVVTAQGLPSSMNGLRLSVCVRKKETKDGAVRTMPSRVAQGAADFEEKLFIRCHVYCNHYGSGKQLKFEPRPFWIYLVAVDAKELNFGRSSVDLSQLVQESIEKSKQGTRVRQWDTSFSLSGKANGGELVLKLGFQIMEKDGGVEIYNQDENLKSISRRFRTLTSSFARKQSKASFSMPGGPRITSRSDAWTPSDTRSVGDIQGLDDLSLDDGNKKVEDFDLPDFDVVEKGVEVQEKKEDDDGEGSERSTEVKSASSEKIKEIVHHDQLHLTRLTELDSIAKQIQALESMMGEEDNKSIKAKDTEPQRLDSDEETVTREFLHMLEGQEARGYKTNQSEIPPLKLEEHAHDDEHSSAEEEETKVCLPDLGKGLGCVVQTKDGGYLASMNPLDNVVARNDTPKLAMQMSKPFVLQQSHQPLSGFELFRELASVGLEELSSQVFSLMPIDELIGKTAEQVAFEGIASAIIQGRNKEGASSSAARIVSALKGMANAMSSGRKERISTGLWNVDENSLTAEKILAFTMQKIESMAVEALKIQAGMAVEEAPFDVSVSTIKEGNNNDKDVLSSAISLEDWIKDQGCDEKEPSNITLIFVVQLRDPMRRYEAVGGPFMVLVHATSDGDTTKEENGHEDDGERRLKVTSMHVGGFKVRSGVKKNAAWDSEKQRLTAMQWLIEYGMGKAGKKSRHALVKGPDVLWSISSTIMGDMWLKTSRNPDFKLVVN